VRVGLSMLGRCLIFVDCPRKSFAINYNVSHITSFHKYENKDSLNLHKVYTYRKYPTKVSISLQIKFSPGPANSPHLPTVVPLALFGDDIKMIRARLTQSEVIILLDVADRPSYWIFRRMGVKV